MEEAPAGLVEVAVAAVAVKEVRAREVVHRLTIGVDSAEVGVEEEEGVKVMEVMNPEVVVGVVEVEVEVEEDIAVGEDVVGEASRLDRPNLPSIGTVQPFTSPSRVVV